MIAQQRIVKLGNPFNFIKENGSRLTRVWSGRYHSYFCDDFQNLTDDVEEAGVFTLKIAWDNTYWAKEDKKIHYLFLEYGYKDSEIIQEKREYFLKILNNYKELQNNPYQQLSLNQHVKLEREIKALQLILGIL